MSAHILSVPGKGQVLIRPLRWTDWAFCWRLAADPLAREMSLDPRPPTWWRHLLWMWNAVRTPYGGEYWILETTIADGVMAAQRIPLGLVSFGPPVRAAQFFGPRAALDPMRRVAPIGVNIHRAARGYGMGSRAVEFIVGRIYRGAATPAAAVRESNAASLRMFRNCGFDFYATRGISTERPYHALLHRG